MKSQLPLLFLLCAQLLSAQTFEKLPFAPYFEGVDASSVAITDIDGDNDPDVLITGRINSGLPSAKVYANNGYGNFNQMWGINIEWVSFSSMVFADVDGVNRLDFILTGLHHSGIAVTGLYKSSGTGAFFYGTSLPFEGVFLGSVAFSDIDSDNDQDVLITGRNNSGVQTAKLYINHGTGNFS